MQSYRKKSMRASAKWCCVWPASILAAVPNARKEKWSQSENCQYKMIWNHPDHCICFDNYSLRQKILVELNTTATHIGCQRWKDNYAWTLWSLFSNNKGAVQNFNCLFYPARLAQIVAFYKNNWPHDIHIIPIDLSNPTLMLTRGTVHHFINNCYRL